MKLHGSIIIYTAVLPLSASSIAFEILLARVFAISQWNHLSFMVISMALFGFAASGTFLSMRAAANGRGSSPGMNHDSVRVFLLLYSVSTLLSFLIVNQMPLDYQMLPVQRLQALYLLAAYLLLALPFFCAGLVLSSAYMFMPEQTGYVYFFNMAGSAAGALIPLILLPVLEEGRLIALVAILPLLALVPMSKSPEHRNTKPVYAIVGVLITLFVLLVLTKTPELLHVNPSPYKSLSQLLLFPNTSASRESTSLRGRVNRVDSPYIRFAPGLSLKFQGDLPQQSAAFHDGDNRLVLYTPTPKTPSTFQQHTLAYAGYLMPDKLEQVLVVQHGGGSAIACALSSGAGKIQVLERNPIYARMMEAHYQIPVSSQNPRLFIGQSPDRFDVIHVENWGASLPGVSALTQDYSFTVDALKLYLSRLSHGGVVIVSQRLLLPPSNILRYGATACEALISLGAEPLAQRLAIVRTWDTFTMIISRQPLQRLDVLAAFAQSRNFDLVWPQDRDSPTLNRYNVFEKPYPYLKTVQLFSAYESHTENRFFNRYPLDIKPQTDGRPFPEKFFKLRQAATIHQMTGSRFYTLLLSGEIVVLMVFAEVLLTALGLLCLPWAIFRKKTGNITLKTTVYFLAVGAGFILTELFFIYHYTLIFDDPVVSFATVLSSILIFSSAGGLFSLHLRPVHIRAVTLLLGIVLFLTCIFADPALHRIILLPAPYSLFAAMAMLLPVGILLGMPFPLGMQYLLDSPRQKAYAWAANGCTSVLAAVAATQIAISSGLSTILWVAVLSYAIAWFAVKPNA